MFAHGTTRDGHPLLEIHYLSRLGDDIENWAIFEGSEQHDATTDEIVGDDSRSADRAGRPRSGYGLDVVC